MKINDEIAFVLPISTASQGQARMILRTLKLPDNGALDAIGFRFQLVRRQQRRPRPQKNALPSSKAFTIGEFMRQ